jgi:hypothetical protein
MKNRRPAIAGSKKKKNNSHYTIVPASHPSRGIHYYLLQGADSSQAKKICTGTALLQVLF